MFALLILSATGCGKATSTHTGSAVSGLSSLGLYAAVKQMDPWIKRTTFQRLTTMDWPSYYALRMSVSRDDTSLFDGLQIGGSRSRLTADREMILSWSSKYPTVGDLWRALDLEPETMSYAEFSQRTEALLIRVGNDGLGLVTAYYPCTGGDCDRTHQSFANLYGFDAMTMAKTLAQHSTSGQEAVPYLGNNRYTVGSGGVVDTGILGSPVLSGSKAYLQTCFAKAPVSQVLVWHPDDECAIGQPTD